MDSISNEFGRMILGLYLRYLPGILLEGMVERGRHVAAMYLEWILK